MTDVAERRVSPAVWGFLTLGVLGVVGGVAFFGPVHWLGYSHRSELVTVEELSGSEEEVVTRANAYLRSPGVEYPYAETAEVRLAGSFPPLDQPMQLGESRSATNLEPTPSAIGEQLDNLEPGQDVFWRWDNAQDPNTSRSIRVVRWKDGSYHMTVTDLRRVSIREE
jgi:hypothetical protein